MKLDAEFAMSRMAGATQVVYLQFGRGNESVSSLVIDCVSKLLIRCRINDINNGLKEAIIVLALALCGNNPTVTGLRSSMLQK